MNKLGTHIPKYISFIKSLKQFYEINENIQKPSQIFTSSPTCWYRTHVTDNDYDETIQYIKHKNLSIYVHSLYLCNIAKSPVEFNLKAFDCLKWEFENGSILGFKGIVIHCGKSLKLTNEEALDNMYKNIMNLLPWVDSDCPFILETSSGQGSELLSSYEEFSNFYNSFDEESKSKIKICIDTCHVFAAGHEPLEFIKKWCIDHPNTLILVHFNDSKYPLGSNKDRHALPGQGFIGKEKMINIYEFCSNNNIHMVLEC